MSYEQEFYGQKQNSHILIIIAGLNFLFIQIKNLVQLF